VSQKTRISVYTTCTNAIEDEFTLFEGMLQALRFCDEFVYVDGGSNDGTLDYMYEFAKKDSRIKVYRLKENTKDIKLYAEMKNKALSYCTGDWCFLLDADEVYGDSLIEMLKTLLFTKISFVKFGVIHVYGKCNLQCCKDPIKRHVYYSSRVYGFPRNTAYHGDWYSNPDELIQAKSKTPVDDGVIGMDCSYVKVYHYGHFRSNQTYLRRKNLIERRYDNNWNDLKDWNFRDIIEKQSDCFIQTSYIKHPGVMKRRIESTVNEFGVVERELFVKFYKNWISGILTVFQQVEFLSNKKDILRLS